MAQKLNPAGEAVTELLNISKQLDDWSEKLLAFHYVFDESMRGQVKHPMQDLVDLGFLHREISDKLDELRKECNARQERISRVIGATVIKRTTTDPTLDMTQRGTLASATPDVGVVAICPKPNTPEYVALMKGLGIENEELIASGALAPHFVRMSEYVSERLSKGLPAPAGVLGTSPTFRVTYIRKRAKNG